MKSLPDIEQEYKGELFRKGIHLCSLSIPVACFYLGQSVTLSILVPVTLAFVLSDLARVFIPQVRSLYHRLFGWLLRSHEKKDGSWRLNGASYVLIAGTLSVWLFPTIVVVTAFSILIISDTVAALTGRRFGKHPFLGKSREGALAFFVSAMMIVMIGPKAAGIPGEYLIGTIGAMVGTVVESLPLPVDDNFTIPFSVGGVMWGLYVFFLPSVMLTGGLA